MEMEIGSNSLQNRAWPPCFQALASQHFSTRRPFGCKTELTILLSRSTAFRNTPERRSQAPISRPLGIEGENKLLRIPMLRDVVRDIRGNDASQTSHAKKTQQKRPVCPRFPPGFPPVSPTHDHGHDHSLWKAGAYHRRLQTSGQAPGSWYNSVPARIPAWKSLFGATMMNAPIVIKHQSLLFRMGVVFIVGSSELLLAVSPLNTTYASQLQQSTVDKVIVGNITDEPFLSKHGNPIGIRLRYTVQFPRDGIYGIYPSMFMAVGPDGKSYLQEAPFQLGVLKTISVEPPPSKIPDNHGSWHEYFKSGITYNFTDDMVPLFIWFDEAKKTICVHRGSSDTFEESAKQSPSTQYSTAIEVDNSNYSTKRVVAARFVTSNYYNMKTFYDSALKEGGYALVEVPENGSAVVIGCGDQK